MAGLVVDAGALILAERNDRRAWSIIERARGRGIVPVIPAVALAQAWRGARNARLAQLVAGCYVLPLSEDLARRTGELCARSRTADVADASVVVTASIWEGDILTTDPDDLGRLVPFAPGTGRILAL